MSSKEKVILNDILIEGVAAEGNAIAHVDGKVLFVPQCIPGDIVDVRVLRKRKGYMEGQAVNLVKPSADRLDPFCRHYGECGGCKWQPLPYPMQLKYKQQQVADQLTRIGHLSLPEISPILGSEQTEYYRNKLEFTFSNKRWIHKGEDPDSLSGNDWLALGFHISGFFDKVLDIEECHLQAEPSNAVRLFIKSYAIEHNLSFFDLREQSGFLRNMIVRTTSGGGTMLIVVFAYEDRKLREDLLNAVLVRFPEITSLYYVINGKKNDSISDLPCRKFAGNDTITERMENIEFKIGPKSFYQTNSRQAYRLYCVVRDFARLSGNEVVYDLYTGIGTIGLFLSASAKKIVGIEYVKEAIEDARANAAHNGITNSVFYAADMKDILTPGFIAENGRPDLVILDPPRAGIHPDVAKVLLETAPDRMVYVSCNPASQARDLAILSEKYRITAVQPVDMFPHTHHVENVVALEKDLNGGLMYGNGDTICALATPQGGGAIGIVRLSGTESVQIADSLFSGSLEKAEACKMVYGSLRDKEEVIDDVLAVVFRAPRSYTGEDCVEIYCHASSYIEQKIVMSLISKGARMAEPGEFSKRAFLNGKMDLTQAEAVADLIASQTAAAHKVALNQMRGGFSNELKAMRKELLDLVSLMELELDFSEEDVEFADRAQLKGLLEAVGEKIDRLIASFSLGNVIKNGVPVAIVGATNTGKSTLLNALLGEEKAIVSDIHGTTRDVIEDCINLNGITFRFIDTAGIRQTQETIEIIGIERTYSKLKQAAVVILMLDSLRSDDFAASIANLAERFNPEMQKLIIVLNKIDGLEPDALQGKVSDKGGSTEEATHTESSVADSSGSGETDGIAARDIAGLVEKAKALSSPMAPIDVLPVSAKSGAGLDRLVEVITGSQKDISLDSDAVLVTNARHFQALQSAKAALERVGNGLETGTPTDLVAQDIREALYHIGTIVGEISTEEILGNIFGKFCIGK